MTDNHNTEQRESPLWPLVGTSIAFGLAFYLIGYVLLGYALN